MKKISLIDVPYDHQDTDYTCGPSSLKMVLSFFGVRESELKLAHEAHTSRKKGTAHAELIKLARRHGFYCYIRRDSNINTIRHFIRLGLPVIINYRNIPDNESHYAVVVGYGRGRIILNDPWNGRNFKIDDKTFIRHWIGENNTKKWVFVISKEPVIRGKQYNPMKR
ncbi:C39 family peptidase [Candidatus Pacearchaeota archaeon]|nr:C39 family peptidase [Candidatus Pacearchaeota archaeon]